LKGEPAAILVTASAAGALPGLDSLRQLSAPDHVCPRNYNHLIHNKNIKFNA
jgi:hypothetical protein